MPGEHVHVEPGNIGQQVALHHWMVLLALEADIVAEAIHHVQHINQLVTGDHLARMLAVLNELQEGHAHDTVHTIEGMLAGSAIPGLTPSKMHLQLALSAARVADGANGTHQMEHFLGTPLVRTVSRARPSWAFCRAVTSRARSTKSRSCWRVPWK